jgi:TonB family protein
MRRWPGAVALAGLFCGPSFADQWLDRAGCKEKIADYYPPEAIRREKVGTVLVEFTVKGNGPPTAIAVVPSKLPRFLQDAGVRVIRSMSCTPDSKWLEDGGPQRRLRVNVIFRLKGLDETAGVIDPDAEEIVITGSPIAAR